MEELILAVNQLADSQAGTLPLWVNIISIIVPILLTALTIYLTIRLDRQNRKQQILLANRDMQNQTRQCVLDIYNAYSTAMSCVARVSDGVASVFALEQSYYVWSNDVQKAYSGVCRSCNQAKLILNDDKLLHKLENARDVYARLNSEIINYISTGIPSQVIANAWSQISVQYGISIGNTYALMQNPVYGDAFVKLCETSFTKQIEKLIKDYLDIVGCDAFDEPFKKYVQISELA